MKMIDVAQPNENFMQFFIYFEFRIKIEYIVACKWLHVSVILVILIKKCKQ